MRYALQRQEKLFCFNTLPFSSCIKGRGIWTKRTAGKWKHGLTISATDASFFCPASATELLFWCWVIAINKIFSARHWWYILYFLDFQTVTLSDWKNCRALAAITDSLGAGPHTFKAQNIAQYQGLGAFNRTTESSGCTWPRFLHMSRNTFSGWGIHVCKADIMEVRITREIHRKINYFLFAWEKSRESSQSA